MMSSEATTTPGGMVVVTQVLPSNQPQPQGVQLGGPRSQRFIRVYPLAVGTVQIMIGILVLLFGIVLAIGGITLQLFSGIFVWGAGFYITAGALTVAAGKSLTRCLINTALGFNVVSSVTASVGIILCCFDLLLSDLFNRGYYTRILISGSSGVLLVFHVLELAVSITVSVFACRATCSCCDNQQQPYVHFTSAQAPPLTEPATMAVPPQQTPSSSKPTEDLDQIFPGLSEPPAYTD